LARVPIVTPGNPTSLAVRAACSSTTCASDLAFAHGLEMARPFVPVQPRTLTVRFGEERNDAKTFLTVIDVGGHRSLVSRVALGVLVVGVVVVVVVGLFWTV
jgi:hypothetical protein